LRLLIIHNKYQTANIGGEDIVFQNELISLQDKLGKENIFSLEVLNDNINKFILIFGIWFSFKYYKKVKKIVNDNNIDIVHVHNFYPLLTPSIFKAGKKSGAKVIHTLHNYRLWCIAGTFYRDGYGICELCTKSKFPLKGILYKCFRKSLVQSFLAQLSFWFYRAVNSFDSVDYFFVLTNFQRKKIQSLGIDINKLILKPNFINHYVDLLSDKKGYVYIGRLEESKGIYNLLDTWKKLDDKFVLTIIGDGDEKYDLMSKYNQSNILFKGRCGREETLKTIAKSKYLIQPSIWYETFGLTIIEAMSLGVPVIGFNIGTRPDFIHNGVNGFLSNSENLIEVVRRSYNYKEYEFLSNNAILKSKEFTSNYIICKQIDIYKNIFDSK
jgi:glycosyltransferase involved in cell wall biosynthesis